MSAQKRIELEVPDDAAGSRLDRFLAGPVGSRARAQSLIDAEQVRVDGRLRPKRHLVSPGELIEVDEQQAVVEPGDGAASFAVAYEDDHLLIIDKPAGVVVHPARGHRTGTLAQALAGRATGGEEPWRAGIVHRLDRDTSGLMVVAKDDAVHRALRALLSERRLRREYLTLVEGHPSARSGTVDAPIGRHRRAPVLMSIDSARPREARTHFEVLEALPACALLRVVLETGRTHQIRVHLAAIGHPVCGDRQYGGSRRYGLWRQFLHAARLAFEHPVNGEAIDIRSPLPADLAAALQRAKLGESQATDKVGTATR
jgi:23S rRNA pseudouridine1911/1915/1917 synthase